MTPDEAFSERQKAMSDTELLSKAKELISEMCKTGGRSFRMSIPPSIYDHDMLFTELIRRFDTKQNVVLENMKFTCSCGQEHNFDFKENKSFVVKNPLTVDDLKDFHPKDED